MQFAKVVDISGNRLYLSLSRVNHIGVTRIKFDGEEQETWRIFFDEVGRSMSSRFFTQESWGDEKSAEKILVGVMTVINRGGSPVAYTRHPLPDSVQKEVDSFL